MASIIVRSGRCDPPAHGLFSRKTSPGLGPQARTARVKALSRAAGKPVMLISGASGEGVPELLRALADMIAAAR